VHEYSVAASLLGLVTEHARRRGATRVLCVHLRVGELAGVDAELLRAAYERVREGTACGDASLEIRHVPLRWACPACARTLDPAAGLRCPGCGGPAELTEGGELLLERIEMEVPDV
jgi:hydrogenase nickel incorporation protein HypA/HybF